MTEPTLSQWRERALVAEALLEERTQEAEKLRAELEDLKAKQPDDLRADKHEVKMAGPIPGFKEALEQMRHEMRMKGLDWTALEAKMMREMMDPNPQWSEEVMRVLRAPQYKKDRSPPRYVVDPKRGPDPFFDEYPRRIEARVSIAPDSGYYRFLVIVEGKERGYDLDRVDYERLRQQPMGLINVANRVAGEIARSLMNMGRRDQDELATRIMDGLGRLEKRL